MAVVEDADIVMEPAIGITDGDSIGLSDHTLITKDVDVVDTATINVAEEHIVGATDVAGNVFTYWLWLEAT